ncbi:MAG: L-seryl-tRNA(Sec) selenium transferase [Candidatus Cloacimonadales bacterium]|jgi:L-seryl-tRNA(Ser) seleniumtransferase|nr:L-seryl-tRNA(Sec) selenium transferase [Candidatus Cloacimonadota bacterium]MDD2650244.1 L-seryl-tRNA(Sec) selenium transferase [Candidatus Cloacimonadota bacterium]MDX9977332.1 L-seryl-tRNA(Sec) selenium transferase [Candidatus Cloacimonadales bacterium]
MNEKIKIPSVDYILNHEQIKNSLIKDSVLLKTIVKNYIAKYKADNGIYITSKNDFINEIYNYILLTTQSQLKQVINATGIILHTNLGRAPLSEYILSRSFNTLSSYSNLEFDLESGKRGDRNKHLRDLINLITGAEDCLIVNNNSAAVFLILNQLSKDKEVIISRSELVEIGGSFRIPDIMSASGCFLKEVGTTNCTNINDYQNAINENTGMIFKAHQSNFYIAGHTEEVDINTLSELAKNNNLPFVYDIGSGLLKELKSLGTQKEPNVQSCIASGIDLISFSGDKLLGGPQCGIIVGKKNLIKQLEKNPLMRILRVDKLTLRVLYECISLYLDEKELIKHNPLFKMLSQTESDLKTKAIIFTNYLKKQTIDCKLISSEGKTGGGTMPDLTLPSYSVQLNLKDNLAEELYLQLMKSERPIISVLKEGKLSFNMLTITENEMTIISNELSKTITKDLQ